MDSSREALRSRPKLNRMAFTGLLLLDALAAGGCIALLLVRRHLLGQLQIYGAKHMAATSTILDLLDDFIPHYVSWGGAFLVLALVTVSTGAWLVYRSR